MLRTNIGPVVLACMILGPPTLAQDGAGDPGALEWHTDLAAAEKLAAERGDPLLIVFR